MVKGELETVDNSPPNEGFIPQRGDPDWKRILQSYQFYPTQVFSGLDKGPIGKLPASHIILETQVFRKSRRDDEITIEARIYKAP